MTSSLTVWRLWTSRWFWHFAILQRLFFLPSFFFLQLHNMKGGRKILLIYSSMASSSYCTCTFDRKDTSRRRPFSRVPLPLTYPRFSSLFSLLLCSKLDEVVVSFLYQGVNSSQNNRSRLLLHPLLLSTVWDCLNAFLYLRSRHRKIKSCQFSPVVNVL